MQIPGANPNHVNQDEVLRDARAAALAGGGNRIVVFGGEPGVGKTATAIECAHQVRAEFPDGALFAHLAAGLDQPGAEAEVLREFLAALGAGPEEIPDRVDARGARYRALTTGRRLLVFLDGAASASQVRTLLPGAGDSLVIVTEGRPLSTLAAHGEVTFLELSPLEHPAARELLTRLIGVERVEAESAEADELIELCDRLPIAVCVAGSMLRRSRRRSVATVVERLRDERRRLGVLSQDQDLSVAAAFNTAYRWLSDPAQACYRALGLRPRSGEVGAAALAAALDVPGYEVVEALAELADAWLVEEIAGDRVAVRGLVRLHAEGLEWPDDLRDERSSRLLRYYHRGCVVFGAAIAPSRPWLRSLFPSLDCGDPGAVEVADALAWLRRERSTVVAAAEHAFDVGEFEMVVQCCVALWPFYERDKYVDDLLALHDLGTRAAWRLSNDAVRSLLHAQAGYAHYWRRDLADAARELDRALDLARGLAHRELEATAAEGLGLVRLAQGSRDDALVLLRRNLELAAAVGDPRRIALARFHLAKAEDPAAALSLLDQADEVFAALPGGETVNRAKAGTWRGKKLLEQGRPLDAREHLSPALETMHRHRRPFDVAEILDALAAAAEGLGDVRQALDHAREALDIYERLGFSALAEHVQGRISRLEP